MLEPVPKRPKCVDHEAAWFNATRAGDLAQLRRAAPHVDPNARNEHGTPALVLATAFGHSEAVRYLASVADVNCPNRHGMTAIQVAVLFARADVAAILTEYPFDRPRTVQLARARLEWTKTNAGVRDMQRILSLLGV